jgi:hypothetical protein
MYVEIVNIKMAKVYEYVVLRKNQYLVRRVDDSKEKKDKERYQEYLVDLSNGDMLCDCKGFYFTKKPCKHIKFIFAQLQDKGGILRFNQPPINLTEYIENGRKLA